MVEVWAPRRAFLRFWNSVSSSVSWSCSLEELTSCCLTEASDWPDVRKWRPGGAEWHLTDGRRERRKAVVHGGDVTMERRKKGKERRTCGRRGWPLPRRLSRIRSGDISCSSSSPASTSFSPSLHWPSQEEHLSSSAICPWRVQAGW